jgi:hypothetical protein
MNMAKKAKKVKGGSDMKIIEAALELGGVPATDDLGEEMSLSGRVISVMQRLHSLSSSGNDTLLFDPHNPEALLKRMEEERKSRKLATNPVRPKQPKKAKKAKKAKITFKAKKAKKPRRKK